MRMNRSIYLRISVRLFIWLILSPSADVVCESQQHYAASEVWPNYCPGPRDAIADLLVRSMISCGVKCSTTPQCVDFSFYSSSRRCYLYGSIPARVSYDADCRFMMDTNAFSGCSPKALVGLQEDEDSCDSSSQQANQDYVGCLSLTGIDSTNGTEAICLEPSGNSVQIEMQSVDLGTGPVPLPSIKNWIIVMQRFDGSLDFNRGWIEYRNGFGDQGQGEFWLGNEKVYLLTNKPGHTYRLHIEVQLYTSGKWFYADYSTFSLDAENKNYAIHVSGFSGVAGDSLTNKTISSSQNHNGMSFSTPDADNDGQNDIRVTPCAVTYSAGWWFNYCWWSCLTCPYSGLPGWPMAWYSLGHLEPKGRLRAARMMITSA